LRPASAAAVAMRWRCGTLMATSRCNCSSWAR
jgi:hypothetical protein